MRRRARVGGHYARLNWNSRYDHPAGHARATRTHHRDHGKLRHRGTCVNASANREANNTANGKTQDRDDEAAVFERAATIRLDRSSRERLRETERTRKLNDAKRIRECLCVRIPGLASGTLELFSRQSKGVQLERETERGEASCFSLFILRLVLPCSVFYRESLP